METKKRKKKRTNSMKTKDLESEYPGMGFEMFMNGAVIPRSKFDIFDDIYDLKVSDVKKISTLQGQYLLPGEVLLVRSTSLPELGDHYILVVGKPIKKDHGIRPETITYPAMQNSPLLDVFDNNSEKVILLKLNKEARNCFYLFNNIKTDAEGKLLFKNELIIN